MAETRHWRISETPFTPVPDDLPPHAAGPRGLGPAAAVMDHRQRRQPPRLIRIAALARQPLQITAAEVFPQRQCPSHACLPAVFGSESDIATFGNPRRVSTSAQASISSLLKNPS
jgi:hypothetical protein